MKRIFLDETFGCRFSRDSGNTREWCIHRENPTSQVAVDGTARTEKKGDLERRKLPVVQSCTMRRSWTIIFSVDQS